MNAQSPNLRVSGSILYIATCHGQDKGMVQREQFIIIIIIKTVVIDQTESWNNNRFPFHIQFLIVLCSSPYAPISVETGGLFPVKSESFLN